MANHKMKLNPAPYAALKSGRKRVELRLNDEKRQQLRVGDMITFSNTAIPYLQLIMKVVDLHHAESFAELFEKIPVGICGFEKNTTAEEAAQSMLAYYSSEEMHRWGALGIEIELVDQVDDWRLGVDKTDVPVFLKRIDLMKCGESSVCPFCGSRIRMTFEDEGHSIFECEGCDTRIEIDNK